MRLLWRLLAVSLIASSGLASSAIDPFPSEAASANPNTVCLGSICTVSFTFTGDYYSWIAPYSTTYTVEVWGAQGGNAGYNGTLQQAGGKGGYARGDINLAEQSGMYIYVGGQGEGQTYLATPAWAPGGWNGGGAGYVGSSSSNGRGSGGGGATDIRLNGTALANRVIVGGGGAGGVIYTQNGTNYPGVGGGLSGGGGATTSDDATRPYNGKGGTQLAAGARGNNCGYSAWDPAGLGVGGRSEGNSTYGGSGGGGGYYGGGGSGCGMAGGGGSGYVGGVTNSTLTAGSASMPNPAGSTMTGREGNGFARITYVYPSAVVSLSTAGNSLVASKGGTLVLTAASDSLGKVTFFADGKKIPGCISLSISVGTKTCTWKASVQKITQLRAVVSPTSGAPSGSSPEISVSVMKRTGTR